MSNSLNNVFYVVKGQYQKGLAPVCFYEEKGETLYLGGFNPYSENTVEWYGLYDNITHRCYGCGNLDSIFSALRKVVKLYRNKEKLIKAYNSGEYRVSKAQKVLHEGIFNEFGDYLREEIEEIVDESFEEIKNDTPFNRAKKRMKRSRTLVAIAPIY